MNLYKMCPKVVRYALICIRSFAIACDADGWNPKNKARIGGSVYAFPAAFVLSNVLLPNFRPSFQLLLQQIGLVNSRKEVVKSERAKVYEQA